MGLGVFACIFLLIFSVCKAAAAAQENHGVLDNVNHGISALVAPRISFGTYLSIDEDQFAEVFYRLLGNCETVMKDEGKVMFFNVVGLNGLLIDTTNVVRKRNIHLTNALLDALTQIMNRMNYADTVGMNIQRKADQIGNGIYNGLSEFADMVAAAFGNRPEPLPICEIGPVHDTCLCLDEGKPKSKKKVPPPSEENASEEHDFFGDLSSALTIDWNAVFSPASPEPDPTRENMCLSGHKCLSRGCFSPDPNYKQRLLGDLREKLPELIAGVREYYSKSPQKEDDKAILGDLLWTKGKNILGTAWRGKLRTWEPPVTREELTLGRWEYAKRSLVKTKAKRTEKEGSKFVRDISPPEVIEVLDIKEIDERIRGKIAPSKDLKVGGWVTLMDPVDDVVFVRRPPLIKEDLLLPNRQWVVIARCQGREAYTLESTPVRNVEIGEVLELDHTQELESGDIRGHFGPSKASKQDGWFTLGTVDPSGKVKSLNVRRLCRSEGIQRSSKESQVASENQSSRISTIPFMVCLFSSSVLSFILILTFCSKQTSLLSFQTKHSNPSTPLLV